MLSRESWLEHTAGKYNRRPATWFAIDRDVAAGLFDEAINHAESQPSALADWFGGKKRLKRLLGNRLRHAASAVGDRDHDVGTVSHVGHRTTAALPAFDVTGRDRQLAAIRHGVSRIDRQIEQGRVKLVWIDADLPKIVG
jgi:hypothetical protein